MGHNRQDEGKAAASSQIHPTTTATATTKRCGMNDNGEDGRTQDPFLVQMRCCFLSLVVTGRSWAGDGCKESTDDGCDVAGVATEHRRTRVDLFLAVLTMQGRLPPEPIPPSSRARWPLHHWHAASPIPIRRMLNLASWVWIADAGHGCQQDR
uniref:Uncharacterized protein n=1 Tax=Leersia perrieri TaxID=77586 RepID=A0A0D9XBH1_9ORYZ